MPGTAYNQDASKIIIGPARVWLDVAIPAASARITLHTDGTPESVANPNAIQIGLTRSGTKCMVKSSRAESEADELTAPYRIILTNDEMSAEGQWLQVEDFALLQRLSPNGSFSTAAGYEQITVGGLVSIPTIAKPSVAVIAPKNSDPTKFFVFHMYQAINSAGFEVELTRKKDVDIPFKFEAQSIASRAAGDQVGNIWKQI